METVITDEKARQNIAANIRRLLEDRGWSQNELARRTGEYPTNISRVVRGVFAPQVGLFARIAEALDVSMDRLVSEPPQENSRKSA